MNLAHQAPRRALALLLAVALFASTAVAATARPYLDATTLDLVRYLPAPPPDDSTEARADLAEVLAQQASRTPAMVDYASGDVIQNVWRFRNALPDALQGRFNNETLPRVGALFERLRVTKSAVNNPAKDHWKRTRPYLFSSAVHPGIELEPTDSWPSGHAAYGTLVAIVLADMLPEYRDAIFRRAAEYAQNRVIGGVHYPSDVAAGRTAGALMALALQDDGAFVDEARAARAELRAALGL